MKKRDRENLEVDFIITCIVPIFSFAAGYYIQGKELEWWFVIFPLLLMIVGFLWVRLIRSDLKLELQRIDLIVSSVMDVLESDSYIEQRADAFESIQELYDPGMPLAGIERFNLDEESDT